MSPKKLLELKNVLEDLVETDMDASAGAILARRALAAREHLYSQVLPETLLENPPKSPRYDNLYVFIAKEVDIKDPNQRTWSKVQEWVKCAIENNNCAN